MQDKKANRSLVPFIKRFFSSLTDNQQVIELAVAIQQNLELGHTALCYDELIEDNVISKDGQSGYIVVNNGLAGFRRFFNLEKHIANDFLNSSVIPLKNNQVKLAIKEVLYICNLLTPDGLDLQWQACLSSLGHTRFILDGGPGTGKTTTVIRLMLLALKLNPKCQIALSAPTGKAANRMMQSINQGLSGINLDERSMQQMQQAAKTIHRLLGYNHETNKLNYNSTNPLPYDLVIIDESSMLDVNMTNSLILALKPTAQLILIGDKNQLPAVDAGNIFADLCVLLKQEQEVDLFSFYNQENPKKPPLINFVELTQNYRFQHDSIIAQLCRCIIERKFNSLIALQSDNNFALHYPQNKKEKQLLLNKWYEDIKATETCMLLSPVNFGSNSVNELNELAKKIKYKNAGLHHNMPIMVTKNDYTLGLFNGDIGVLKKLNGMWVVPFVIEGKEVDINLEAINGWVDANAISIHKSQGSEYDHVLIALPDDNELEILSNTLLYTAISRAKKSITIWSKDTILSKTINSNMQRTTFLKKYKIIEKKS
jgi:exodeoxyribonuclease V alpha subunit